MSTERNDDRNKPITELRTEAAVAHNTAIVLIGMITKEKIFRKDVKVIGVTLNRTSETLSGAAQAVRLQRPGAACRKYDIPPLIGGIHALISTGDEQILARKDR